MRAKTVLIIVDMQSDFVHPKSLIVKQVIKALQYAKRHNWHIIDLEYKGCGNLVVPIRKLLPSTFIYIEKADVVGGHEVRQVLNKLNIKPLRFVITGVYATQCVAKTVSELSDLYSTTPILLSEAIGEGHRIYYGEKAQEAAFTSAISYRYHRLSPTERRQIKNEGMANNITIRTMFTRKKVTSE